MTKTYQAIGWISIKKEIVINGKHIKILFTGGKRHPKKVFGTYQTDDKAIQKALESDPQFNKDYRLMGKKTPVEQNPSADEAIAFLKKENERLQRENSELKAEINLMKKPEEEKVRLVEGVTNAQQAKDYLVKEFGHDPEKLKNKMLIMNASKKYKVAFPDWKK